jgi:four helix bundle protein
MGARNYRDLDAWRLADEIRAKVIAITSTPPASRDFKYCDQIRGAAASVSANIAEGFARRSPGDFARFLSIAKGSLLETQDRLRDGVDRQYLATDRAVELLRLTARCDRVVTRLRAYLYSCKRR